MLTNRLTGQARPYARLLAAIYTPPGSPLLILIASQSKSTTTVSSQLGRSLA